MTFGLRTRIAGLGRSLRRRLLGDTTILMYHRIADSEVDPWSLCVSPANFSDHLAILRKAGACLTLKDLVRAWDKGTAARRSFVVTFDDGYADNCHVGLPILERFDMPATMFMVSTTLGQGAPFWWDKLDRIFLHDGQLPAALPARIAQKVLDMGLGEALDLSQPERRGGWSADDDPPSSPRQAAYLAAWQIAFEMAQDERTVFIDGLVQWAGRQDEAAPLSLPMSVDDAVRCSASPLIEVGAHTRTHPSLPALAPSEKMEQINASRRDLESLLGRPVETFSFPHGRSDAACRDILKASGFAAACTSSSGVADRLSDRFDLPRLHVRNWSGDEFAEAIHG